MYEDVVCGIVKRLDTSNYPGGLFEALIHRSPHAKDKLMRTRHLVVRMRDVGGMLGTLPGYHSFEKRRSLLSDLKSVKIVVDQGNAINQICRPWGIDYESKTLKVGAKQKAMAVLNNGNVAGHYNGDLLARLIKQDCFDQKVKIMFEVHTSSRKALLMKVNKDWEMDMEVVWKTRAVGSSLWF